MAREYVEESEEAERHCLERRSRRLLRRRHLSKQERCELAEVQAARAAGELRAPPVEANE